MRLEKRILLAGIIFTLTCSCAHANGGGKNSMFVLASALTKLTRAVETTVQYEDPPDDMGEGDLLRLATKHDPALLERFRNYVVHVYRKNNHADLLVCTKDGTNGLLEDAGCTARMDVHLWTAKPLAACAFTLNIAELCDKGPSF